MLHEIDIKHWSKMEKLFESHILYRSVLQPCAYSGLGSLMVDNTETPTTAQYSIPMLVFLAGDATSPAARELVKLLPQYTVTMAPDKQWKNILKNEWGNKLVVNQRTHLDHRGISIENLHELKANLPEGYRLKRLDREVLPQINDEYAIQIQMYFGNIENLIESGFGFCVLHNKRLVSYAYTA
ncbi:GNAT family N-acetyltransferase, partial [Candidatus Thorarchaeota archaeon]